MDNFSALNSSGPSKKGGMTKVVVGVILAALGCLGLVCVGTALALLLNFSNKNSIRTETTPGPSHASTLAPAIYSPTQNPPTSISSEQMAGARQTMDILQITVVPENDPISLAERFFKTGNIQQTVPAPSRPYAIGDTLDFWVSNTQTNTTVKVQAVMAASSQHLYFWIQKGVTYDQVALNDLVDVFENHIYATDRRVFGSEWLPGVDNDPHLHILYTRGLGGSTAGYFSSADEYPSRAHKYSNAKE